MLGQIFNWIRSLQVAASKKLDTDTDFGLKWKIFLNDSSSTNKSRHAKFMFVAEGKTVPAVPE